MYPSATPHSLLIRQIETVSRLYETDRQVLSSLPMRTRMVEENRDVVREGQTPTESCLLLSGVLCRYKLVAGGRRQILSFHFAGDMPDLQSLLLDKMDHSIAALTPASVAFIPHEAIQAAASRQPNLADAFYRRALIDGSIFREWIANVGRRLAVERVAHLICECFERMHAVGLANTNTFSLPVTQTELGDATGLSTVHVNRTMQTLKRLGLIETQGKVHTIRDWPRLRETADYDPGYLHMLTPMAA